MTLIKDLDVVVYNGQPLDLNTYVGTLLLTRGRAKPGDSVQDPTDLGGFWGDSYPDTEGYQVGSRLWTLQGQSMAYALERAPEMVKEALQVLIDLGLLLEINPALYVAGPGVLAINPLEMTLPSGKVVELLGPWHISV